MIPVLKIPFYSKKKCLDILLLLFEKDQQVAKNCLIDSMSNWIDDLEEATWELVLDSTIIRIRTNNLFNRLSLSYGNKMRHDKTSQSSRDDLSCIVVLVYVVLIIVGTFKYI